MRLRPAAVQVDADATTGGLPLLSFAPSACAFSMACAEPMLLLVATGRAAVGW